MSSLSSKKLLIILPENFRQDIDVLSDVYLKHNIQSNFQYYENQIPNIRDQIDLVSVHDAVLLISSSRRAPSKVLPGPFIDVNSERRLPIALLPVKSKECINNFANTIDKVHSRTNKKLCMAVLSQRMRRFLSVANRVECAISKIDRATVVRWTGEQVYKQDMVDGLMYGIGCAIYMGHGRPVGWCGYYGTRLKDFEEIQKAHEPIGGMFSLCCLTASRKRTGTSFSEGLVNMGVTAASFGAVKKTKHVDNTRWAIRICQELKEGAKTVGEVIVRSAPIHKSSWEHYRIIGDPFAPVYSTNKTIKKAIDIPVYP